MASKKPTVIIGDERSGMATLAYALTKHYALGYSNNPFKKTETEIPYPVSREIKKKFGIQMRHRDKTPVDARILKDKDVFGEYISYFRMARIKYSDLDTSDTGFIEYINEKCNIIHITRSPLDKAISLMVAMRDNCYRSFNKPDKKDKIYINVVNLKRILDTMESDAELYEDIFDDCPTLEVNYYTLTNNSSTVFQACLKFMDLPYRGLYFQTHKLITEQESIDIVSNKDEVIRWMGDNGYGKYL